jgi:hypothetical protein
MEDQGGALMAFVALGVAIGGLSALLRYRVLMMIVLSALLAVGTVLAGFIFHTLARVIVAEAVGSIVVLQFAYVAVSLTHHLVHSRRLIPRAQAAIHEQLSVELEAPRSLPPELSALVAQLPSRGTVPELSRDGDFVN